MRELLSPPRNANLQVIRTVMPPGYSNRSRPFRHLGVESVHVLEGRLRVFSDTDEYLLEAGDTLTYDCSTPHWWENPDDRAAVILGSVIPLGPLPCPVPGWGDGSGNAEQVAVVQVHQPTQFGHRVGVVVHPQVGDGLGRGQASTCMRSTRARRSSPR